jgi:DNA-binding transcriptional LysR family regulator
MIVPQGLEIDPGDPMRALAALPFLRYGREQMISRQIDAQLRRYRLDLPDRFELDSNPAIHALVGHGSGWAITTALGYLRSQRFHDRIDVHPLPFEPFARTISLFAQTDWIPGAATELAQTFRGLLRSAVVLPARERFPWLTGQIAVLDDPA